LGEYPEIANFEQNAKYSYYEMDFGRRLVAKFSFDPTSFWSSSNFPRASEEALYPTEKRDRLLHLTNEVAALLASAET
jgi:hypothetical protein